MGQTTCDAAAAVAAPDPDATIYPAPADSQLTKLPGNSTKLPLGGASHSPPFTPKLVTQFAEKALSDAGYTDVRPLAQGGFGAVYLAKDAKGNRKVIKFLTNEDAVAQRAFEHESKVMNLLAAKDPRFQKAQSLKLKTRRGEEIPAFEMDFLPVKPGSAQPANTLLSLLVQGDLRRNPEWAPSIRRQYARILAIAQENGIAHADVKPANLLVSFDANGAPVVHVIDWGLSHGVKSEDLSNPLFIRGRMPGSPFYTPSYRSQGEKPKLFDDVHASRIIDWQLRQSSAGAPLQRLDQLARAHDEAGTMRERMTAMAEWSQVPQDIPAREKFIQEAATSDPGTYLEAHGRALMALPDFVSMGYRRRATIEILGSSLLIDQMDVNSGLKLSKSEIDAVARTAAKEYLTAQNHNQIVGFFQPGPENRAPEYYFAKFGERIDALAKQGITKPWSEWKMGEVPGPLPEW